jgi:hypothetical protein
MLEQACSTCSSLGNCATSTLSLHTQAGQSHKTRSTRGIAALRHEGARGYSTRAQGKRAAQHSMQRSGQPGSLACTIQLRDDARVGHGGLVAHGEASTHSSHLTLGGREPAREEKEQPLAVSFLGRQSQGA